MHTVTIKTSFFPLSFLFYFCSPTIVIDGKVYKRFGWGKTALSLPAGTHTIRFYIPYALWPHAGDVSTTITFDETERVYISFWMPPWVYWPARVRVKKKTA